MGDVHALLRRSVRGVRMTGSCCLAMCHVARGWATLYYENDVGGLWDVAAGIVIVREMCYGARRLAASGLANASCCGP